MTINASYGQFCPVAMAAEIVCTRWTPLVLRELLAGSTRFNQLRKGVPLMSPALLSKRLKELEEAGLIRRSQADPKIQEYLMPAAGEEQIGSASCRDRVWLYVYLLVVDVSLHNKNNFKHDIYSR